jgi:hypothetical protein
MANFVNRMDFILHASCISPSKTDGLYITICFFYLPFPHLISTIHSPEQYIHLIHFNFDK